MKHISSKLEIGNELKVKMRLKGDPPSGCASASVTCGLTHCDIKIDPTPVYCNKSKLSLSFESYDEDSNSQTEKATLYDED